MSLSFSDIQGTPVQVGISYVAASDLPPPKRRFLGGSGTAEKTLRALVLSLLPLQSEQNALNNLLSTPLDKIIAQTWSQFQSTAQQLVRNAIQNAEPNAYNINVSFPPTGKLRAAVGLLSYVLVAMLPPGTQGKQLTLSYTLSGVGVTFSAPPDNAAGSFFSHFFGNPSYLVTFDLEIEIAIAVPDDPTVPLEVAVGWNTHHTQAGTGGGAGGLEAALNGLVDVISNWISTGNGRNPPPSDQNGQINSANLPLLPLGDLSSGFAAAASLGFTQLAVRIDTNPPPGTPPGNTVEFDLTHPFDPGPVVTNALASPPGPSFVQPEIGTSAPSVNAGGTLGVTGSYFPAAQSTQLTITWNDTASGVVSQSEVQWGIAPTGQAPPSQSSDKMITRHGRFDNGNRFTAKGLTPTTPYAFRVRDYDVNNLVATAWGAWTVLTTAATDQVQLVLDDGHNTVIGFATLQTDGTFLTTVIIPSREPAGTYNLWAVLSDQQMASTPITVVASGQALPPVLQILNPDTNQAYKGTVGVVGTYPVKVRGSSFSPGSVNLFVDSPSGQSLGQAVADQNGSFTVTLTWPFGVTGPHNILAQQNALQETAAVYGEYPAQ